MEILVKRSVVLLSICLWIMITMNACYYDVADEINPPDMFCDTLDVSYAEDILPLMVNQCYVCHSVSERRGGVILEPYVELIPWVDSGLLSCTINHGDGCSAMPDNAPKMLDCQILLIDKWIADGAQEN